MRKRHELPPLNALRAFEAAARNMSFTAASEELCVTPSAISHQVRFLEDFIGLKLFTRHHKVISLTAEGVIYLNALSTAFNIIGTATQKLVKSPEKDVLAVRLSLPTFAMKWLIPRLHRFQSRHAGIDVRITTSLTPVNFKREQVDVFLTRDLTSSGRSRTGLILDEHLVIVCSPRLLDSRERPRDFSRLTNRTRIVTDSRPDAWPAVYAATGLAEDPGDPSIEFEHYYLALQAAVAGLGVAAVPRCLVEEELDNGMLVQLIEDEVSTNQAYYIAYPEDRADQHNIQIFHEWLLEEASAANMPARHPSDGDR